MNYKQAVTDAEVNRIEQIVKATDKANSDKANAQIDAAILVSDAISQSDNKITEAQKTHVEKIQEAV